MHARYQKIVFFNSYRHLNLAGNKIPWFEYLTEIQKVHFENTNSIFRTSHTIFSMHVAQENKVELHCQLDNRSQTLFHNRYFFNAGYIWVLDFSSVL